MTTNCAAAPMADNPNLTSAVLAEPPVPQPLPESFESVVAESRHKFKLHEYARKSSIPFPVYHTVKEGPTHATVFRSTVWVKGRPYVSTIFLRRKSAEQDAARVALSALSVVSAVPPLPRMVNRAAEGSDLRPFVNKDTMFAKSILNEYGAKKRNEMPVYYTVHSHTAGKVHVFWSSVAFDGKIYKGQLGQKKKEAEQLAARAAILAILDSDGGKDICEIVKAKHEMYTAVNDLKETLNAENRVAIDTMKRKHDAVTTDVTPNVPCFILETPPSVNEFKKPRLDADTPTLPPNITFAPGSSETVPPSGLAQSADKKKKKKNRKKKNKANQGLQLGNDQISSTVVQTPPVVQ